MANATFRCVLMPQPATVHHFCSLFITKKKKTKRMEQLGLDMLYVFLGGNAKTQ